MEQFYKLLTKNFVLVKRQALTKIKKLLVDKRICFVSNMHSNGNAVVHCDLSGLNGSG